MTLGWFQVLGLGLTVGFTVYGLYLARRALMRVERAFLFAEGFDAKLVGDQIMLDCTWKNSGSTPAVRVIMRSAWKAFPTPLILAYHFPDLDAEGNETDKLSDYVSLFLGPGATTSGIGLNVPMNVIQAVVSGAAHLYVWGWVEYDDILSRQRHRTEFCQKVAVVHSAPNPTPDNPDQMQAHLTFRAHWQHNGTDGQCMKQPSKWPGNRT